MSKIIYICFKNPSHINSSLEKKIEMIIKRITPDNISPRPPEIVVKGNVIYGIGNPTSSIEKNENSVLLGMAYGDHYQWWKPEGEIPDGSYSIFRSDNQKTEVLTDVVGSRTVWYYHDDQMFISSSSQRAIVMMVGSFLFNKQVIPWMLSTGTLGPFLSWDERIKMLLPDSSMLLDYSTWTLTFNINEVKFKPNVIPDNLQETELLTELTNTFKSLKIDFKKWVLPLSGGYDSRGILSLFNLIGENLKSIKAITWGIKSALNQVGNDAYIAKRVADHYKIDHKYYLTDNSTEPIENIFERFLVCGEGRIDHVSGYMDGFAVWKNLFLDNVEGIIRGDVSFSAKAANASDEIRKLQGIYFCSDFSNLKEYFPGELLTQNLPQNLTQKDGETLEMWRDRLYQQYRMPIILAALSDLKLPFLEVINPLLSRSIIIQTRNMPDHLRSDKILFKNLVNSIGPKIEYAKTGANANKQYFLKSKPAVDLFRKEFISNRNDSILPEAFMNYLLENLEVTEGFVYKKPQMKIFLLKLFPSWLKRKAKKLNTKRILDINVLAFRTYLVCKMNLILNDDAIINK